jgi:hypothetical protein
MHMLRPGKDMTVVLPHHIAEPAVATYFSSVHCACTAAAVARYRLGQYLLAREDLKQLLQVRSWESRGWWVGG